MVTLKKDWEIDIMRQAGRIVASVLELLRERIQPGIDTASLDEAASELIERSGGIPAFKGYTMPGCPIPFPGALCISINEEVVHGIPSRERLLREGDIVSVDVGVLYKGYYGDAACTYPVGKISSRKEALLKVTLESLHRAIAAAQEGKTLGDVGHAIESYAISQGFSLVRNYCGHGIGRKLHEPPQVPNYGRPGNGVTLKKGMTIAIEPMVLSGGEDVVTLSDRWTVVTADGADAAHFEHTVLVTDGEAEILTPWE